MASATTSDRAASRAARWKKVRERMESAGVDALLLSLGADLPWISGYEAMPLERLTMMVVPREAEATLVVPLLEAPRVGDTYGLFSILAWSEQSDPIESVASALGPAGRGRLAVSERTWARAVLALQDRLPGARWTTSAGVVAPLRAVKDEEEIGALAAAAAAADRVAGRLQDGEIPLVGRSEAEVSRDIATRLIEEGHQRVNFAIVASGPNGASPHHEPGPRVIVSGDPVVCDFGGTWVPQEAGSGTTAGYCSDITRTVVAGGTPPDGLDEVYRIVMEAQVAGVEAAVAGAACQEVDSAARRVIDGAGFGEYFVHRTGHGIGLEEHEDPYIVDGNRTSIVDGHCFSVEPGIYLPGRFGVRIEDIVVARTGRSQSLNRADHQLVVVDA